MTLVTLDNSSEKNLPSVLEILRFLFFATEIDTPE